VSISAMPVVNTPPCTGIVHIQDSSMRGCQPLPFCRVAAAGNATSASGLARILLLRVIDTLSDRIRKPLEHIVHHFLQHWQFVVGCHTSKVL
jgi:hypothetical protein